MRQLNIQTVQVKKDDESISFFKLPKDPEWKKWISKLKCNNLPKEENIYVCHFHFDISCFKRDFRVSSIFQPLYFIHLCVGIEYRFCDNIHFFLPFTIFLYMKPTQKRKNNRKKTKLFN